MLTAAGAPMSSSFARADAPREMRQCLEPLIAESFRARAPLREVTWERFGLATSYAAYVATVTLADGGLARLFVKDFASTVRPKDDPRQRREREVGVYRELLDDAALGTARYHGALLDDARGRFWLLLEFVDGTPVGYCDIAQAWAPAAAALGRLHGHFAGQGATLARSDFLVHHTAGFFWSKVEQAARAVETIAPGRTSELAAIVRRYEPAVAAMTELPRTLVHGGCRSTNILVRVAGDPDRVCIIDWEEAAYGSPLYDLAWLLDGIESPLLDPLLDAWVREAVPRGVALPARRDLPHRIACFRLHMILAMLGQAVVKGYDAAAVAKLLGIGARLRDVVFGRV